MLRSGCGGGGDAVLAAVGVLWGLALPVVLLREGRRAQRDAVYKLDPATRRGCSRAWLGAGEWLSLRRARVERWGIAFRAALPGRCAVLAADAVVSQLAALAGGFGGGSCAACGWARVLDGAGAAVFAAAVARTRPYSRPMRLPLTGLYAVAALLAARHHFVDCPHGGAGGGAAMPLPVEAPTRAARGLLAASGAFVLLSVVLDVSCVARGAQLRRRDELRASLRRLRGGGAGGDGALRKHELRARLGELWGARASSFDAVFARVDHQGGGEVSLREFLSKEYLFWEAGEGVHGTAPAGAPAPTLPSSPLRPLCDAGRSP
eukprot:gene22530-13177_t